MSKAFVRAASGFGGDPSLAGLPLTLAAPALFAVNTVVARWAESAGIPPFFLAFGRWLLAFLILLPWLAASLRHWRHVLAAKAGRLLLLALLGMGVAVGPQYLGARSTSAANIALFFSVCPMLVALIEALLWKVPLGPVRTGGMLLSFAGILTVLSRGDGAALTRLAFGQGDGWVLLAACGWAAYTVLGKRRPLPPMPAAVRLAALSAGGALVLAPCAAVEAFAGQVPDFADGRLYAALVALAVVPSLGAYLCYDRLVAQAGPAGASVAMYMVPLYASLAAWPLLGEAPRMYHAAGFGLILLGVVVAGKRS